MDKSFVRMMIWFDEDKGWCVQSEGAQEVYVYGTKRSGLTALEKELDKTYGQSTDK